MNNLILTDQMSTIDFATLTGNSHSNVLKKTTKLLTDLGFDLDESNLSHEEFQILIDDRGYKSEILLNRDLSLTLAGQYKPQVAYKVAQRFNKPTLTPMQMIATTATAVVKLEADIQLKADKAETEKRLLKLEANLKPSDGLTTGSYPMGAIKEDQGWKPASSTLVALIEAYGSPVAHKRGRNRYYSLHETIHAMAAIVAASERIGTKTLTYQDINYVWFK